MFNQGNPFLDPTKAFNLDFSATWTFNDNLQFTLEALNLTDEFQDQWVDSRLDADWLSGPHQSNLEQARGR